MHLLTAMYIVKCTSGVVRQRFCARRRVGHSETVLEMLVVTNVINYVGDELVSSVIHRRRVAEMKQRPECAAHWTV
jgi:hypothetical protein